IAGSLRRNGGVCTGSAFAVDGKASILLGGTVRDQSPAMAGGSLMTYQIKPLSCDPAKIKGMSERLIVSHYENNYGGAGESPHPITEQPPPIDYKKAARVLPHQPQTKHPTPHQPLNLHELVFSRP